MKSVKAKDKEELKNLISQAIQSYGNSCDLNHIDVSAVRDMSSLFFSSDFNGDISQWDTSKVTNMSYMFLGSNFNGDISKWNTSNVGDMDGTFQRSVFNGDISRWDVSSVENMSRIFCRSFFNQCVDSWEPFSLNNIDNAFFGCSAPPPAWLIEDKKQRDEYLTFRKNSKVQTQQLDQCITSLGVREGRAFKV